MNGRILVFKVSFFILFFILGLASNTLSVVAKELSLDEAIDFALKNSPTLLASKSGVDAAKHNIKAAKGRLFPQITGYAGYDRKSDPVVVVPIKGFGQKPPAFSRDQYRAGISVIIPIYEGGRLRAGLEMAKFEKEIESKTLSFTVQELIANITNVYNQVLFLKKLESAKKETLNALKKAREDARLKLELGRLAPVELMRIDTQVAQQQQELISTSEAKKRALHTLCLLMGWKDQELPQVKGTIDGGRVIYKTTSENNLIDMALENRPDIKAAKTAIKKAEAALQYAKGGHFPNIDLVGDYSRHAGSGLHADEEVWTGGLSVSINLFSGGTISAQVAEAASRLSQARHLLTQKRLQVRQQVLDALSAIKEAQSRLKVAEIAQKTARETYRIEKLKYDTGAGTVTDVLLAQAAWKEAEANLLEAKYSLSKAIVELRFALGIIEKGVGSD